MVEDLSAIIRMAITVGLMGLLISVCLNTFIMGNAFVGRFKDKVIEAAVVRELSEVTGLSNYKHGNVSNVYKLFVSKFNKFKDIKIYMIDENDVPLKDPRLILHLDSSMLDEGLDIDPERVFEGLKKIGNVKCDFTADLDSVTPKAIVVIRQGKGQKVTFSVKEYLYSVGIPILDFKLIEHVKDFNTLIAEFVKLEHKTHSDYQAALSSLPSSFTKKIAKVLVFDVYNNDIREYLSEEDAERALDLNGGSLSNLKCSWIFQKIEEDNVVNIYKMYYIGTGDDGANFVVKPVSPDLPYYEAFNHTSATKLADNEYELTTFAALQYAQTFILDRNLDFSALTQVGEYRLSGCAVLNNFMNMDLAGWNRARSKGRIILSFRKKDAYAYPILKIQDSELSTTELDGLLLDEYIRHLQRKGVQEIIVNGEKVKIDKVLGIQEDFYILRNSEPYTLGITRFTVKLPGVIENDLDGDGVMRLLDKYESRVKSFYYDGSECSKRDIEDKVKIAGRRFNVELKGSKCFVNYIALKEISIRATTISEIKDFYNTNKSRIKTIKYEGPLNEEDNMVTRDYVDIGLLNDIPTVNPLDIIINLRQNELSISVNEKDSNKLTKRMWRVIAEKAGAQSLSQDKVTDKLQLVSSITFFDFKKEIDKFNVRDSVVVKKPNGSAYASSVKSKPVINASDNFSFDVLTRYSSSEPNRYKGEIEDIYSIGTVYVTRVDKNTIEYEVNITTTGESYIIE